MQCLRRKKETAVSMSETACEAAKVVLPISAGANCEGRIYTVTSRARHGKYDALNSRCRFRYETRRPMTGPPRRTNRDQDIPTRTGENMGAPEPIGPRSTPTGPERNAPLPEEETYERNQEERRRDDTSVERE